MPVRLTPHAPLLLSYDLHSKQWISVAGFDMCILSQYVDIVPDTRLGHIVKMVESDKDTKRFLAQYCACDIDALHRRSADGGPPIEVPVAFEKTEGGRLRVTAVGEANALAITPCFCVYTDEATGERCLKGGYDLLATSLKDLESGVPIHSEHEASFGFLCGLELRLDPRLRIDECDEEKLKQGHTVAFEATIQYTLMDVLVAIYQSFGNQPFDERYQRDVHAHEAFLEQFRRDGGIGGNSTQ